MKRKYTELPIGQKLEVLKELEKGLSSHEVAMKFDIAKGTVANIKKNKDFFTERSSANDDLSIKRNNRMKGDGAVIDS